MNPDGSDQTRLTNNVSDDDEPSWSPDGQYRLPVQPEQRLRYIYIYVMNADGSGEFRLTNDAAVDANPD